jgi:outer membrane lipoprotein-sorting protein
MNAVLIVLAAQAPAPPAPVTPPAPTAGGLISAMLRKYAGAKSFTGAIRMVQTAMNTSLEIDTALAYERPGLFYLLQKDNAHRKELLTVSDGVRVSYPGPETKGIGHVPRLIESIHNSDKPDLSIGDMYVCAQYARIVTSLPLDAAIGRNIDLKQDVSRLGRFELKGKVDIDGQAVNQIIGKLNPPTGTFEMDITDDGDLVRYVTKDHFGISPQLLNRRHLPTSTLRDGVEVETVYEIKFKVDPTLDHSIFHL